MRQPLPQALAYNELAVRARQELVRSHKAALVQTGTVRRAQKVVGVRLLLGEEFGRLVLSTRAAWREVGVRGGLLLRRRSQKIIVQEVNGCLKSSA